MKKVSFPKQEDLKKVVKEFGYENLDCDESDYVTLILSTINNDKPYGIMPKSFYEQVPNQRIAVALKNNGISECKYLKIVQEMADRIYEINKKSSRSKVVKEVLARVKCVNDIIKLFC